MAKNVVKVMLILFIAITILNSFAIVACADQIFDDGDDLDYYNPARKPVDTSKIFSFGGVIIGFIRAIGSIVSISVLIIMGINYMYLAPEGKAEYKNKMIQYLVGMTLVFATSQIIGILYDNIVG